MKSKTVAKKKKVGSQPGLPGSTGFRRVKSLTVFYLNPARIQARVDRVPGRPGPGSTGSRVDRVPGRPAGPGRVSKLWERIYKKRRHRNNVKAHGKLAWPVSNPIWARIPGSSRKPRYMFSWIYQKVRQSRGTRQIILESTRFLLHFL